MDLISGLPYWPRAAGQLNLYPPLSADAHCEVAIIGAGITGALIAHALCEAGMDVVVVDGRDVASGSTSASTGLLQYEIDTHLIDLIERHGLAHAQAAYRACLDAIGQLHALDQRLDGAGRCTPKHSLYYASRNRHVQALRDEAQARRAAGIAVQTLESGEVRERFGFDAPLALLSTDAAEIDVYRFAHALLQRSASMGARIFDRTTVLGWPEEEAGGLVLHTDREFSVHARHVIVAAGFESRAFLRKRVVNVQSSYAWVTEPLALPPSLQQTLIWESARPYLYMRTTADGRLMVGGQDDSLDIATRRDLRVAGKARKMLKQVSKLFPELPLEIHCAWAGTFGETHDGLPFIDASPDVPGMYLAMAYGGNGITYSLLAAQILRDRLRGVANSLEGLFRLDRA